MTTTRPALTIDGLLAELKTLATISEAEPPVVTRVVFSDADMRARAYAKGLCTDAGLSISEDAIGNTFARWQGSEAELPPIGTGSHIDAIPNAGLYDGCVGVLGGLEAIRVLQKLGFKPRRSIELVIFTAEEPTRFGIGCLGSRMMANVLTPEQARRLRDKEGRGLEELRTAAGFKGPLESVAVPEGRFHRFIELHIEQGPLLEQEGIDVGLVTHIAAPASMRVVIEGEGGHAGGKLMPGRKDALTAAAELILALESAAKSTGAIDTVATVGVCEVFPGAVNSIPARAAIACSMLCRRHAMRLWGAAVWPFPLNWSMPIRLPRVIWPFSRHSKNRPSLRERLTREWSAALTTIRCSWRALRRWPCSSFPAAAGLVTGLTNTHLRSGLAPAFTCYRVRWPCSPAELVDCSFCFQAGSL
jgi:hydantoinase/carbamoylase family amidase